MDEQKPYEFSAKRAFADAWSKLEANPYVYSLPPVVAQRKALQLIYSSGVEMGAQEFANQHSRIPAGVVLERTADDRGVLLVTQGHQVRLVLNLGSAGGIEAKVDGVDFSFESAEQAGYVAFGLVVAKNQGRELNGHTEGLVPELSKSYNLQWMR
jgi:hypothetical protein